MGFVCPADLGNAFSDDRLGDDELGFSAGRSLGLGNCVGDFLKVVAIDLMHFPPVSRIARGSVLALGNRRHGIQRYIVGIVNENEIVEAKVPCEGAGFLGNAFLQATITGQGNDMMVENGGRRRVKPGLAHFG